MGGNWWVEVVFLAMLAGFIALRLVSVLGRRTGHERPVGEQFRGATPEVSQNSGPIVETRARPALKLAEDVDPRVRAGLEAIAAVDPAFDPARLLEGAKSAYAMILDAFWKGDTAPVDPYISDEVGEQFRRAIAARESDGHHVENRVLSVDSARIVGAHIDGNMAEATIHIDAAIAGVTRDREERVIAGNEGDVIHARDDWTFRRHLGTADPSWLLVATETAEG